MRVEIEKEKYANEFENDGLENLGVVHEKPTVN